MASTEWLEYWGCNPQVLGLNSRKIIGGDRKSVIRFRCTNRDFYVALGSSVGLALLIWVGGGLLKRVLYFIGNEPSLGRKSPILHLPPLLLMCIIALFNVVSIVGNPSTTPTKENLYRSLV